MTPPKALPHVVTGLIAKRREIAGRIEDLQRRLREAVVELDHIEASIRIFKPDIDLDEIMPRPVPPPHAAFKGEVTRVVLESLRKTERPLTTREVTYAVMESRDMSRTDVKLTRIMQQRVGACLNHWRRRGYLRSQPGPSDMLIWEILEQPITGNEM